MLSKYVYFLVIRKDAEQRIYLLAPPLSPLPGVDSVSYRRSYLSKFPLTCRRRLQVRFDVL